MTVSLQPINAHNWQDVLKLKVSDEQSEYVADNRDSLIQAKYDTNLHYPVVIYNDEQVVGFALYSYYPKEGWHLSRLMIDHRHHQHGYGQEAAKLLIEKIGEHPTCTAIKASYHPDNDAARKLLASVGFVETGTEDDYQQVELKLDKEPLPAPNIGLREITSDNLRAVCRLKVAPGQEHFVANNPFSIAQSKVEPLWKASAIYDGETPVGFIMYGNHPDYGWFITRLMTDARWQGRGYGRKALEMAIADMTAQGASKIGISYEPENEVARQLYASLGFVETEMDEDEMVAVLTLPEVERPAINVSLREINADNVYAVARLKVAPNQENFVASNTASLVQAQYEPHWRTRAIYDGDTAVGFAMYGHDPEFGWGVLRLMTDAKYQSRGYGKAAMQLVLDDIRAQGGTSIGISYEDKNVVARKFYASLGFVETGEQPFGEPFAVLKLDN